MKGYAAEGLMSIGVAFTDFGKSNHPRWAPYVLLLILIIIAIKERFYELFGIEILQVVDPFTDAYKANR